MTPFHAGCIFHTLRGRAVDNTQNPASLFCFGDDHLHRVCRRTKDRDDLGHILDAAEDIDGETVFHHYNEGVPRADGLRIAHCRRFQFLVVAFGTREAFSRSLIEGNSELHLRHSVDDRFVDVFHRLDEMRLTQNNVGASRDVQPDCFEFHQL